MFMPDVPNFKKTVSFNGFGDDNQLKNSLNIKKSQSS
jgi:hypothetical protein